MRYIDEYRQKQSIRQLAGEIQRTATKPWRIMEICGGQTHAIMKYGLQQLLPESLELIHGPGCPVCVTSLETMDLAISLASRKDVIFCSFGDMLRVPGSSQDLLAVKAAGGDIRTLYSPLHALDVAEQNPDREVVLFAIGFETTAPAHALTACLARERGLANFSILVSHFLVPPAIEAICASPKSRIQAFLAAGHVCSITGYDNYHELSRSHCVPIVVTGFEPLDILDGILACVRQLEQGEHRVENRYARAVKAEGNPQARARLEEVFEISAQTWRGVGPIPFSGLTLRPAFSALDARKRFSIESRPESDNSGCLSGAIMQGLKKPHDCPHFGKRCRPEHPLGAPMVSSEGACAAYYRYRKRSTADEY
ncbi:hydrogenase formation protein HypD [Microbulbifer guangxiensis]|uniref:hydrogenase formation protein HypD n=1 Tax=Microbulbifer guangxiensis TaxID=2904249 RepID=UPI001F024E23